MYTMSKFAHSFKTVCLYRKKTSKCLAVDGRHDHVAVLLCYKAEKDAHLLSSRIPDPTKVDV